MKKIKPLILLSASLFLLMACSTNKENKTDKDGLNIVTTFYPMYEFTKQVVGDEGNVSMMITSGVEPHDYEPTAKDIARLHDADVFVYNNENMETWVPSILKEVEKQNVTVIKATDDMTLLPGIEDEEEHDHEDEGHSHELDPHVWLAPSLAIKEVETIKNQLIKAYPDKQEVFTQNAEQYLKELYQLDEEFKTSLNNATQKSFVTQHAAFGYLATEYGLTQVPIAGLSPDEEPSPKRIAELKKYVDKNKIDYIYFEDNANAKVAKTLANETGVKLEVLDTLESLSKEKEKKNENYITVMRMNLKALEKTTQSTHSTEQIKPEKEEEKTIAQGYFEDKEVKDRELRDWEGNWQSVYPLLLNGSLDDVFDYKAKISKDKSAAEYKKYYTTGYQTNVDTITVKGNDINFIYDGENHEGTYKYTGLKLLNYDNGNRGVRYLFEALETTNGNFKYVQFSDHGISPDKAEHFHLYFGNNSHDALLKELDNWPTYYEADLSDKEVAQEMMAH